MPVMLMPVKNRSTANMMIEEENTLAIAKHKASTYDTSSMDLRPYLRNDMTLKCTRTSRLEEEQGELRAGRYNII